MSDYVRVLSIDVYYPHDLHILIVDQDLALRWTNKHVRPAIILYITCIKHSDFSIWRRSLESDNLGPIRRYV
jgi:hypothetical protein